jgi:nicotinamide-nucleotide amidase
MLDATIINLGSELTKGETVNTNASYIARELTKRGIPVSSVLVIPDEPSSAEARIRPLLGEEGIYIFTGGLGGTEDDLTRGIISRAMSRPLVMDAEKESQLREYYRARGREFHEQDRLQASHPEQGLLLDNTVGLAYGFYCAVGNTHVFSLPGVPREMTVMFDSEVIPILNGRGLCTEDYHSTILSFSNIPEYTLDRRVSGILDAHPGVTYGTRAHYGVIRVRLDHRGDRDRIIRAAEALRTALKAYFVSEGDRGIADVAGDMLRRRKLTVGTAESCTAGLLSATVTAVPGSSDYFRGGVTAYSNDIKEKYLSVRPDTLSRWGAASEEAAREMAEGALDSLGVDIGVSITGIAGPGGGTPEKPVGTVFIGIAGAGRDTEVHHFSLKSDRETIREIGVNRALFHLIRFIGETKGGD